jgi:hypothetical protein
MLVLLFSFFFTSAEFSEAKSLTCDPKSVGVSSQSMVERINGRHDDFLRLRLKKEERERRIQAASGEVKEARERHERQMEQARQAEVRKGRPQRDTTAQETAWLKEQKRKADELEAARLCYVQKRDSSDDLLKSGRDIPALEEFDLQDY